MSEASSGYAGGAEGLARRIGEITESKLGSDLVILDVRPLVGYTDFLVVCTARNPRQARAIHDEVVSELKSDGLLPARVEGLSLSEWVLVDYVDCVLHVFCPELRERYRLEELWGEAARIDPG